MIPIHNYKLTYDDGDTQSVSIRLSPEYAEKFYLGATFGYWCAMQNAEKSRKVESVEYIIPDMSSYPQIGLSADWIYRAWLLHGNKGYGVVIFENEEDNTYSLIAFYRDEEYDDEINTLYTSDSIEMCLDHFKNEVKNVWIN
jgi:hypothetical protein